MCYSQISKLSKLISGRVQAANKISTSKDHSANSENEHQNNCGQLVIFGFSPEEKYQIVCM